MSHAARLRKRLEGVDMFVLSDRSEKREASDPNTNRKIFHAIKGES
jgi:hypothetical protein